MSAELATVNTNNKTHNRGSPEKCIKWDQLHNACLGAWRNKKERAWICKDLEEKYYQCIQYGWGAQH